MLSTYRVIFSSDTRQGIKLRIVTERINEVYSQVRLHVIGCVLLIPRVGKLGLIQRIQTTVFGSLGSLSTDSSSDYIFRLTFRSLSYVLYSDECRTKTAFSMSKECFCSFVLWQSSVVPTDHLYALIRRDIAIRVMLFPSCYESLLD